MDSERTSFSAPLFRIGVPTAPSRHPAERPVMRSKNSLAVSFLVVSAGTLFAVSAPRCESVIKDRRQGYVEREGR